VDPFPNFTMEVFLDLRWVDPRLAFDGSQPHIYEEHQAAAKLEAIWQPDLEIENEAGPREVENQELIIHPDGRVEYQERFRVAVHAHFDLARFPFDRQRLEVDLESFAWDNGKVVLTPLEELIGYEPSADSGEWSIESAGAYVVNEKEIRSDAEFSELIFYLDVERDAGYYIWKLIVPFLVILALSWSVFWMTGEPITGRMMRSFIALLAIVASHRVIVGYLPQVSTITYLDALVYAAYLFMALTIVENVVFHRLHEAGRADDARKVDEISRWSVPGAFILLAAVISLFYLA
ncbi:MAG: hypothetical protein ACPGUC_08020, partial [Gammaproteobacteria bacterium]